MGHITSNLCAVGVSLGKQSNEEIMSPSNVGMGSLGGPSKRTRQNTRKKVAEALVLTSSDIIESIAEAGKEMANIIKELL